MGVNSSNLCRSLALHVPTASSTRCSQGSRKPPNTKENRTQESIAPNKLRVATLGSQQQTKETCLTLRRQDHDDDAWRAARAMTLTQMGELSAARQALEGAPVAPGTMSTKLTNPEKRPLPRAPLSPEVAEARPVEAFELDSIEFLTCLRKARRGAAAGPSGMTSDHLFPVLENEGDSNCCAGSPVCCQSGRSQKPFWRRFGSGA